MAIIYTYPITDPLATDDTVVITDVSSSNKATKTATIEQIHAIGPQGTVTSVGISMPAAFNVANSPITENGVLAVTTTGGQAGQFLDYTGNWSTPSGNAANPAGLDTQVQYNDGGSGFGAGAFFTTNKSNKVDITYELGLKGDGGSNQGLLKLYCEAGTTHHVGIKGPNHTGGSPASYTIQLPNSLPNVNNQILESDASGTLSWIPTPSASGVTSFNTLTGAVTISAGTNITLTPSGNDIQIAAEGSSLTVQDDTTPSYADISTINFIGGGVAVGNPSTGQVDVTVLPRLNHGFSPFPIYQGSNTIAIPSGSSLAIAGQTICDIAAGQLTITRIFGNLPADCIIKVAVYSGSLTFPNSTQLVYFGTETVSAATAINDIHTIDEPFDASAGNSWVPVAGTPITTVIEIDNENGSTNAQLLGTLGAASLPQVFQKRLAFEVAPVAGATSVFDAAGTGNTVLGSSIQTIGNYAGRSVTSKRVCQHFDPDII